MTISINKLVGALGNGTYVLAQCSGGGTVSGTLPTLVGAGVSDVLQFSGNQLQLVVATPPTLTWTGNGANNLWDIGASMNWLNGGGFASTYADASQVFFNNTGGTNPVVNLTTTVSPNLVTVSGSTNYTFIGAGAIAGGASLVKNGTNTLTILNTNTFIGTVFLNSGTLALGNAGTNGSFAASITSSNGAMLVFNTPMDQTSSNVLSGTGSVTKLGAGALTMTANSTLTGPTLVSAGTLSLGDGGVTSTFGSLGSGNVTNNATLAINPASAFTMSNAVVNNGVLMNLGASGVTLAGAISGTGLITNTSAAGQLSLAASNSFSGGTFISSGNVLLQNFAGFGLGNVVFDAGASSSAILIQPASNTTNVIANNISLPQGTTPQFVSANVSVSTMATLLLTGVISGGAAGADTPIVNGGGTPTGNPRLTVVLANPNNTFTMNPVVNLGCLAITSDGSLGDVNNNLTVSATADFPGSGFTDAINLVGLRFDANNISLNPNRTITLTGNEIINVQAYNGTIAGPVTGLGLVKLGSGTLTVYGPGSLTGATTVNAGTLLVNSNWSGTTVTVNSTATLGGSGMINAAVQIASGGTLLPGASIGALDLGLNSLSFTNGSTALMEINAGSGLGYGVTNIGAVNYGGTLSVTNVSGTPALGQSYLLFSATNYTGSFAATNLPALGGGLAWNWNPAGGTLSVVSGVATNPTNITASVSGGNLKLSWPADHTGWRLLVQTNSLTTGLGTNWFTWPNSTNLNSVSIPMAPANPSVFFELVYP